MSEIRKKIPAAVLLCILALILSGCRPPNYTRKWKKELAERNLPQLEAWFSEHKPGAEIKKAESVADGVDLYDAMEGTYQLSGKTYRFIYDCYQDKMYTDENYQEVCGMIEDAVTGLFLLEKEKTEFLFLDSQFSAHLENDDWKPFLIEDPGEQPEFGGVLLEGILPDWMGAEEFAQKALSGEVPFRYAAAGYGDEYPDFDPALFEKAGQNLISIDYYVPVDAENFYGPCRKTYRADGVKETWASLVKLGNGLYGGWYYEGIPGFEDTVLFTEEDKKSFSLTVPDPAIPVIFSEKKQKLKVYFQNSAGESIEYEADSLYRDACPGRSDCYTFSTDFMMKNRVSFGYRAMRNANLGGVYHFKKK